VNIDNLKDLEALVKLCRKTGISTITVGDVTVTLAAAPAKLRRAPKIKDPFENALAEAKDIASRAKIKYQAEQQNAAAVSALGMSQNGPSELDMLLWSSGGSTDESGVA
jgi:hypothetical protein